MIKEWKQYELYVDNGSYGVLVSSGFGAGWSTWNKKYPTIATDKRIIKYFIENRVDEDDYENFKLFCDEFTKYIERIGYENATTIGIEGLYLEWVPLPNKYEIKEHDGREELYIIYD